MQRVAARLGQHDRSTDVPDLAAAVTERARLAEALALLSEEDQEAAAPCRLGGTRPGGAARAMGCSRGAMAVRLHRARRRLKRALQATSGDVMSYGRMS